LQVGWLQAPMSSQEPLQLVNGSSAQAAVQQFVWQTPDRQAPAVLQGVPSTSWGTQVPAAQ
jgi:hypothetical protein